MDKVFMLDPIKALLKFSPIKTDDAVFRLHYKFTSVLFLVCAGLVTATQFFGMPIHCNTYDVVPAKIMENFCWVEGTITVKRSMNATWKHIAAPGVDQMKITDKDDVREHIFYQWVSLFLLFEAAMFYFPRWLWRSWERGRMRVLVAELNKPFLNKEKKDEVVQGVAAYFVHHRYEFESYAQHFFFCQVLNLINVIGQIFFIDRFLGGEFTTYGWRVLTFLQLDDTDRIDPMIEMFPKMTKCRFLRYGTSGEVQSHDSICLLSLNVINEKIFVMIWFWLVFLAIVTVIWVFYQLFFVGFPKYRYQMLSSFKSIAKKDHLEDFNRSGATYGDWFVLHLLKNNMRAIYFNDVVRKVSEKMNEDDIKKSKYDPSESKA